MMSDKKDEVRADAESDGRFKGGVREQQGLLKYAGLLAAAIIILAGIHCARAVLGAIILAAFFAVLLTTPINWLKSKGMPSWCALTVAVVAVAGIGLGTMTIVGAQLAQFAYNIPTYRDRFNTLLEGYDLDIGEFIPLLKTDKPDEAEDGDVGADPYLEELRLRAEYEKERAQANERAKIDDIGNKVVPDKEPNDSTVMRKTTYNGDAVAAVKTVSAISEASQENAELGGSLPQDAENAEEFDSTLAGGKENKENRTDGELGGLTLSNPPEFLDKDAHTARSNDDFIDDLPVAADQGGDEAAEREGAALGNAADDGFEEYLAKHKFDKNAVKVTAVNASSQELFRFIRGLAGELSYLGSNAFLVTLLVIFMLCETAKMPEKLVAALGKRRFTNTHIEGVLADIRNYMLIKTLMSVIVGACVLILCWVSRIQYPALWGIVAFLLNYIPNIGSVAAAIPPIVLATVDHGLMVGAIDAVFFVLINCIVGYGVEPRVLGDGLDLSPLIVLISLIFFGWLIGPVGMFLSPPLAVVMKIIFQSFPETRWIASLMAMKPTKAVVDDEEISELAA